MRASSSSTGEPQIAGYRLVRETRRDATTTTYDAVQLELERPVTLTLLAPGDPRADRFRAAAWPSHPSVVALYAAGAGADGFFIAARRVDGATTMRRRIAAGADPSPWLADVRAALAATGAVHGALDDEASLLVDGGGRALVTGFGLGPPGATAADDERALARLQAAARGGAQEGRAASVPAAGRRRPRWSGRRALRAVAAAPAVLAALALAVIVLRGGGPQPGAPPAPAAGALALGSALAPGPLRSVDCDGEPPSGRSAACTLLQRALPGRRLVVARAGAVVGWHVRGARGLVALRVIRPRAGGRFASAGGSEFQALDGGLRSFRAALAVRRGDRLGIELAPGAAAGLRATVRGATTARFVDPLRSESRPPDPGGGRDEELLLRVDYVPRRVVAAPVRLAGAAAEAAPAGRRLLEREIDLADGARVTAAVVALPGAIAVDVLDGARRRARITVPGADPRGRPAALTTKGEADLTLAWRNPGGARVEVPYRLTAASIAPR